MTKHSQEITKTITDGNTTLTKFTAQDVYGRKIFYILLQEKHIRHRHYWGTLTSETTFGN